MCGQAIQEVAEKVLVRIEIIITYIYRVVKILRLQENHDRYFYNS
jgi:hypothetical protein